MNSKKKFKLYFQKFLKSGLTTSKSSHIFILKEVEIKFSKRQFFDDPLSEADHLQLSAKAVNEVVPAAVHAVEDEQDVEDDDEEAEHDLHT